MRQAGLCVLVVLTIACLSIVCVGSAGADAPAALSASPTSVAFGDLPVGSTALPQQVTITNKGGSSASLNQVTISGAESSAFGVAGDGCSGVRLDPDQSCTLTVSASSQALGSVAAQLNVSWSSPATSIGVTLSATFLHAAQAVWTPVSLPFGPQPVGTASAPAVVTLSDAPGSEFFDAETLSEGGDASQFTIVADDCSNSIIDPSRSCTVQIEFTPTTPGHKTASLTPFCMCGVGNSIWYTALPLSGTAVAATPARPRVRISQIFLSSPTIRWCKGCGYPKTTLRFRLTAAAVVRVPLQVKDHGRWHQVAASAFHAHAGPNRYRISGRWHGKLRHFRHVRLLVQTKSDDVWRTHKTLPLTIRSR